MVPFRWQTAARPTQEMKIDQPRRRNLGNIPVCIPLYFCREKKRNCHQTLMCCLSLCPSMEWSPTSSSKLASWSQRLFKDMFSADVSLSVHHLSAVPTEEEVSDPLKRGLQVLVSCPVWVRGHGLRSSGGTARTFIHWATCPATQHLLSTRDTNIGHLCHFNWV